MKKIVLTVALMVTMLAAKAQNFWVVETGTTNQSIVKIYNANNELLNEIKVERKINIRKKKERRALDKLAKSPNNTLAYIGKR